MTPPSVSAVTTQTGTRRGLAESAKLSFVALVEPGTRFPPAVRGGQGMSWSRGTEKWVAMRLWTSPGGKDATALELLSLYARRWEQEVFFKQCEVTLNA